MKTINFYGRNCRTELHKDDDGWRVCVFCNNDAMETEDLIVVGWGKTEKLAVKSAHNGLNKYMATLTEIFDNLALT